MVLHKGITKSGKKKVVLRNETGNIKKLMYIITNPLDVPVTVTVMIEGVMISPKNLVIGVGQNVKDQELYIDDQEIFEIVTSNSIHYYVVFE